MTCDPNAKHNWGRIKWRIRETFASFVYRIFLHLLLGEWTPLTNEQNHKNGVQRNE